MSFNLSSAPFTSDSLWNQQVPNGATYTTLNWPTATGWNYAVGWNQNLSNETGSSPPVYVASSSDPVVQVSVPASWGWPGGTVSVHVPAGATGGTGTDAPAIVIDGDTVYNFWQFNRTSDTTATASAYGEANVLTSTGWGTSSQGAGIVGAGASELGGLLVKAQTDTGTINHALQLELPNSILKSGFVPPAIAGDGTNPNGTVQEGQLLAIPPGTPMPSGLSPLGQEVFRALQQYGAYVIDNGVDQTSIRAQANAYDAATMNALRLDVNSVLPLLEVVSGGTPTPSGSVSGGGTTAPTTPITPVSTTPGSGDGTTTPTTPTTPVSTTPGSGDGTTTPTTPTTPVSTTPGSGGGTTTPTTPTTPVSTAPGSGDGTTTPTTPATPVSTTPGSGGGTTTPTTPTTPVSTTPGSGDGTTTPTTPATPVSTTPGSGGGTTAPTTPTTPVAPTLTVANQSLRVSPGGSVSLGLGVSVPNAGDNVSVNISGLPRYETITDELDGKTFRGSSVTLTAAEVNSGLTLSSSYQGRGHPTATLTVTALDATGTPATSAAQTITVKDPPSTTTSSGASISGISTGGGTSSGQWWHDRHPAVAATGSGTSATTSSTSSGQSRASHGNITQWFNDHPDFARAATTLSEAGASRSGALPSVATTTADPVAGTGARSYALLNQMMAGDFGRDSHFAQGTTALSALSQQLPNFLTRGLH